MVERTWRIVFMGTPGFAVPSLQYLVESGYPVVGVITAPDKQGGRGMKQLLASPVKHYALEQGLPVLQPVNLKSRAFVEALKSLRADLQVVVAFRMLPDVIWNMPSQGTMNLHGSLLPAFRGAAPIQWAIIRGEKVTGITTFLLQHEIDTGHILFQQEVPILGEDTAGTLHDRMMHAGAGLVLASVDALKTGQAKPHLQDESRTSHAPKIHHEDGHIKWDTGVGQIHNLIRGMSPAPGAWTKLDGQEFKIWKSRIHSWDQKGKPGAMRQEGKSLIVQTQQGELELLEVQLSGKRKMSARDFLNGYTIKDWSVT